MTELMDDTRTIAMPYIPDSREVSKNDLPPG